MKRGEKSAGRESAWLRGFAAITGIALAQTVPSQFMNTARARRLSLSFRAAWDAAGEVQVISLLASLTQNGQPTSAFAARLSAESHLCLLVLAPLRRDGGGGKSFGAPSGRRGCRIKDEFVDLEVSGIKQFDFAPRAGADRNMVGAS